MGVNMSKLVKKERVLSVKITESDYKKIKAIIREAILNYEELSVSKWLYNLVSMELKKYD
jgi:hypothetical protein